MPAVSSRIVTTLAITITLVGCTRSAYREAADREAYAALTQKTQGTPWALPAEFNVEPDPRSRFFIAGDPVDPLLPAPGPSLYQYQLPELSSPRAEYATLETAAAARSAEDGPAVQIGLPVQPIPESYWDVLPANCLARMLEFTSVLDEYSDTFESGDSADLLDPSRKLALTEIVELALLNSREFQTAKEDLYLAALALTLEQFDYDTKFTPTGNGVDADYVEQRTDGSRTSSSTIGSGLTLEKTLATGGTLLAGFANSVVLTFDGPEGWATDIGSELFVSLNQSLFQRDTLLEPLIQSERNLVYAARDFARFRRTLFVDLAARYYGLLENFRSVEIESQNYFSLVRTYEQARAEARLGVKNAPNPVAVDQFEQSMLSGRSDLISRCNDLERSLDVLKQAIGLPTEMPINIDLSELDQLTLRDEIQVAEQRVRRWRAIVADRRGQPNPDRSDLLGGGIFMLERLLDWLRLRSRLEAPVADSDELLELLHRLRVDAARVELERTESELDVVADPTAGAPVILLYARTREVIEALLMLVDRQVELAELLEATGEPLDAARVRREETRKKLEEHRERIDEVLGDDEQRGLDELLAEARQMLDGVAASVAALDELIGTTPTDETDEEKLQQVLTVADDLLELTGALLEAAGPGLPLVEISVDDAMGTALTQRFDLMNERGRLADAWRDIKLSADELRSVFNVSASASIGTVKNRPFDFSFDESRAEAAITFDLPLNRVEKRNVFRRTLLDYQAALRRSMALEDSIKLDVRDDLRTLDETRIQYPISVTQAALAAEQVISVKLQLALGVPGVRGTDLLDAQEDKRRALTAVANSRIGYLVDRARLALGLEVLDVDGSGLWLAINDPKYQPVPDLVYPENAGPAYGELPSYVWSSDAIERQLDAPLPGEAPAAEADETE